MLDDTGNHHQAMDEILRRQLQSIIDNKAKPVGALGMLENLAIQVGQVLETTSPIITHPHIVIFAADHGITRHGVSAYPSAVTAQMVINFTKSGAAINVFCRQHGFELTVVDAGVDYDFPPELPILNHKTGKGTNSFLHGPAMKKSQVDYCLSTGRQLVRQLSERGCNTIGLGEMGIGNTSSAAVLMSMLCDIPLEDCIGRGTGIDDEQLRHKHLVLKQAVDNYTGDKNTFAVLAHFGGYEIIQMAGAILEAYKNNMLILVDGFIATVAYLCAFKISAEVKRNAIFCHQSDEQGHKLLLDLLKATPLLQLRMRLGEGTGCAIAFPIIQSAVAFLTEMASLESAGISKKGEHET